MKNNGAIVLKQETIDWSREEQRYNQENPVIITSELLEEGFIIVIVAYDNGEETFFYVNGTLKAITPQIGNLLLNEIITRDTLVGNEVITRSTKLDLITIAKEYVQETVIHKGDGGKEHILVLSLDLDRSEQMDNWIHLLNHQHKDTDGSALLDEIRRLAMATAYSTDIENVVTEASLITVSANPGSQYATGIEESLFTNIDIQEDLWKRDDKYPGEDDDDFVSRREKDAINQREKDRKLGSNKHSPKANAYPEKSQANDDSDVIDVEYKESKDSKTEPKPDNVMPDATKATVQSNGVSTPLIGVDEPTKGQPVKEVTPDPSPIVRIKDTLIWGIQVVLIFIGYIGLSLLFAALSGSLIPVVTNIFFPIIIGIAAVVSRSNLPSGSGSR
jgi:hypothetical protein